MALDFMAQLGGATVASLEMDGHAFLSGLGHGLGCDIFARARDYYTTARFDPKELPALKIELTQMLETLGQDDCMRGALLSLLLVVEEGISANVPVIAVGD